MPTGKLFDNLKEKEAKKPEQDFRIEIAQDFERLKDESKAYWYLMKRISDMKDVAHYNLLLTAGDAIGAQWKVKLVLLDEILGIPLECQLKSEHAQAEEHLKSLV